MPRAEEQWINPQPPKNAFDTNAMFQKAGHFIDHHNNLAANDMVEKAGFDCGYSRAHQKTLRSDHSEGITQYEQRSNGNLTYRPLRRLSINAQATVAVLQQECVIVKDLLF